MKLKEGMYVRTKKGKIGKITDINLAEVQDRYVLDSSNVYMFYKEDISQASHNIGEILEAGDFLDFHCIGKIEGTTIFLTDGWFIDFDDVEDLVGTICTKEQFKQISYEVCK